MGKIWKRIESVLQYLEHAKITYEVVGFIVSIGAGKLLKAVLVTYTRIPSIWVTPIWLLFTAGVLFLALWFIRKGSANQKAALQNIVSTPAPTSANFNADDFFKKAYRSPFEPDVDGNLRAIIAQNNPPNREEFLIKLSVVFTVLTAYEMIWAYIYRSQILLLEELNRRLVLPLGEVKPFYDAAAGETPNMYAGYSFDQWLNFLKTNDLVIHHPNGLIEGTNRCRDFLKYLVHLGRSAKDRRL